MQSLLKPHKVHKSVVSLQRLKPLVNGQPTARNFHRCVYCGAVLAANPLSRPLWQLILDAHKQFIAEDEV